MIKFSREAHREDHLTHQLKLSPKTCMKWFPRKATPNVVISNPKPLSMASLAGQAHDIQVGLRAG
jgi:hypothetical protein